MQNEIVRQKQHRCSLCKEILADDYIEQNPFPAIQCPCCGSLMELSLDTHEEIAPQNLSREEKCGMPLRVTYTSFKRFVIDYANNVSKGNMFIKTKTSYEMGSRVDLLLHVASFDEPIRIMGRVIRSSFSAKVEDAGIGIEFIDIDKKSREILIQKLKSAEGVK